MMKYDALIHCHFDITKLKNKNQYSKPGDHFMLGSSSTALILTLNPEKKSLWQFLKITARNIYRSRTSIKWNNSNFIQQHNHDRKVFPKVCVQIGWNRISVLLLLSLWSHNGQSAKHLTHFYEMRDPIVK
jgi:hypothetical protein